MYAAQKGLEVKVFYSTPDCYLKAVKDADPVLPIKQDDFFPYASDKHSYWTGFYTSKPTTKYFERQGNNYLQVAKQLQVLANLQEDNMIVLDALKSAMGIMQHHDAVTGTEKDHVTHDYERILDSAIEDSLIIPRQAVTKMMYGDAWYASNMSMTRCRLNESSCRPSEYSERFVVTIYNPLGWEVNEPIRIPVVASETLNYEVFNICGKKIISQMVPIPLYVKRIPTRVSRANYEVLFKPTLPPLTFRSFYVRKITTRKHLEIDDHYNLNDREAFGTEKGENRNDDVVVKKFDDPSGKPAGSEGEETVERDKGVKESKGANPPHHNDYKMDMMSDAPAVVQKFDLVTQVEPAKVSVADSGLTYTIENMTIAIEYGFYPALPTNNNPNNYRRGSGAYIFRPNATKPTTVTIKLDSYISGPIVKETRVTGEHIGCTLRSYDNYFEIDNVVGPINVDDNIGKEYIIKYSTNIANNGEFYTDSNARQLLKRKFNDESQEPISGNYYPVSNYITIEKKDFRRLHVDKVKFAIVTDRAEGGSSLANGQIELMLHRRLLYDDGFGVDEPLNEMALNVGLVARMTHRGVIIKNDLELRKIALGISLHPTVFVSPTGKSLEDWLKLKNEYRFMKGPLADGLHLLTLEPWGNDLLIRFENLNESPSSLYVDMGDLFRNLKIKSYKETTLAANRYLNDYEKWEWNKNKEFVKSFNEQFGNVFDVENAEDFELVNDDDGLKINLKSKQIRTFIVQYDYV